MPVLNSARLREFFQNPKLPLLQRLQRLAQLQTRVRRSGFIDVTARGNRRQDGQAGAAMWRRAASCSKSIEARRTNPCREGHHPAEADDGRFFTEGALSARARELILGYLATPGFLAGYFAQRQASETPRHRKGDGRTDGRSGQGGITAETGLKIDRGLSAVSSRRLRSWADFRDQQQHARRNRDVGKIADEQRHPAQMQQQEIEHRAIQRRGPRDCPAHRP